MVEYLMIGLIYHLIISVLRSMRLTIHRKLTVSGKIYWEIKFAMGSSHISVATPPVTDNTQD